MEGLSVSRWVEPCFMVLESMPLVEAAMAHLSEAGSIMSPAAVFSEK